MDRLVRSSPNFRFGLAFLGRFLGGGVCFCAYFGVGIFMFWFWRGGSSLLNILLVFE